MSLIQDRLTALKTLEASLFASDDPLGMDALQALLVDSPFEDTAKVEELVAELQAHYSERGVTLVEVDKAYAFRTAQDIADNLRLHRHTKRKLSRAAMETLAIIAYHQPTTRAEIEEVRGVALSKGTLDVLLESEWIAPKGRRRTPGKPLTWGTTQYFLDHFGLKNLSELPGVDELKAAGLLDSRSTLASAGLRAGEDDGGANPLDNVDVEGVEEFADRQSPVLPLDENLPEAAAF